MHGNMILVLKNVFQVRKIIKTNKKVPISVQDCLGTMWWSLFLIHATFRIPLHKIENARVQKLSNRDYILFLNTFKSLETDTLCTKI